MITGGCQCGALRYRFAGPLSRTGVCHCRMCQKAGGNFGLAFVTAKDLVWTRGEPGTFRSSPAYERGFCRDCGTPLFMRGEGEAHDVTIGTLDDPQAVERISTQIGLEDKCRWFDTIADAHASEQGYSRREGERRSFQHPDHDTDHWQPRSER